MKLFLNGLSFFIACTLLISCQNNPTKSRTNESFKWISSMPEDQGINSSILSEAREQAENLNFVYSLLVIRNGYLVLEDYFRGYDKTVTSNIRSVTKSILSALVGIAKREDYLKDLDSKVLNYFPEYLNADMDPRVPDITIRHLLTMKAGFDFEESITSPLYYTNNWIQSTLELPLKFNPGEKWSYVTPGVHLLSGIITKTAQMSTLEFANKFLFERIKINLSRWITDPQGYYFGGSEMYFTPRDVAKFGYVYLNKGFLDGEQVIPEDWIAESLQDYVAADSWTWGAIDDLGYGYLWWTGKISGYELYFALGYGGQYLIIIPSLEMIIVTTSDSDIYDFDVADEQERKISQLVTDYILTAITD